MDKIQVQNFYKILREFLLNLRETFPEKSSEINDYWKYVRKTKKPKYVKQFMNKIEPYSKAISHCDETIFDSEEPVYLLKNIDFVKLFKSDISENSKNSIWQYLQGLYILGNFITNTNILDNLKNISSNDDNKETEVIKDMLTNIKNLSEKSQSQSQSQEKSESESEQPQEKSESESEQSQEKSDTSATPGTFGLIESLAKEISDEIDIPKDINVNNPADLFHSMFFSKEGGFAKLLTSVGEKIKTKVDSGELNEDILMKETQNMMSTMQGLMGGENTGDNKMGDIGKMFQGMMGGKGGGMPNIGGLGNILGSLMSNKEGNDEDDEEFPDLDDIKKKIQKNRNQEFRASMKREQLRRKLEQRRKMMDDKSKNPKDI